jgi:hypothetical protein
MFTAMCSAAGSCRRSTSPAERNLLQTETVKVAEAVLTHAATDLDRKPRKMPPIETLMHS